MGKDWGHGWRTRGVSEVRELHMLGEPRPTFLGTWLLENARPLHQDPLPQGLRAAGPLPWAVRLSPGSSL